MKRNSRMGLFLAGALLLSQSISQSSELVTRFPGAFWTNSVVFPIGVWLQSPKNAERFKAAGINVYVGLWKGPTEEQLQTLTAAGMPVICAQNAVGLAHRKDRTIAAWMHGDEPDNAQGLGNGQGYGPPIRPEVIQRDYEKIRSADPDRAVLLNLGQGVAWDDYIGRGVRRRHPEDYREYVKGCDIASFDIYPVVHDNPEISGRLEYVARGVKRLREWCGNAKAVWNCIECTHISNPAAKATPDQIRSEVWMSIINGSQGLIYFVHEFKPEFREAAVLDDAKTLAAITRINKEVQSLAAVIKGPQPTATAEIRTEGNVPVAALFRRVEGTNYLFAVAMGKAKARADFKVENAGKIEVLSENRFIPGGAAGFSDEFAPYAVHLYKWQ